MPDRDKELKAFYRLLRQRQISGDAGRVQIANRLAKMSLAELLRVPPWVIVRLGPKGLALLAERSAVIRLKGGGSPQIAETADVVVSKPRPKLESPPPAVVGKRAESGGRHDRWFALDRGLPVRRAGPPHARVCRLQPRPVQPARPLDGQLHLSRRFFQFESDAGGRPPRSPRRGARRSKSLP